MILKEIMVRLWAMTLVALEREDEARALDRLVEATIKLNPPAVTDANALNYHKDRLHQSYSDRIGYNAYVGRLVTGPKRIEASPR